MSKRIVTGAGIVVALIAAMWLAVTWFRSGPEDTVKAFIDAMNEGDTDRAWSYMAQTDGLTATNLGITSTYSENLTIVDMETDVETDDSAAVVVTFEPYDTYSSTPQISFYLEYDDVDEDWKITPDFTLPSLTLTDNLGALSINDTDITELVANARKIYLLPGNYEISFSTGSQWYEFETPSMSVTANLKDSYSTDSNIELTPAAAEEAERLVSEYLDRCLANPVVAGPQCGALVSYPITPPLRNLSMEVTYQPIITSKTRVASTLSRLEGEMNITGGRVSVSYESFENGSWQSVTHDDVPIFDSKDVTFSIVDDRVVLNPRDLN